ncbi:hypothetical protein IW150_006762, partial [Coemansia sp. RSA 2607]
MPYEVALVERLIASFKDMLPCYSGRQIDQLSADKEFYENVNVLIQLHEMRLSALLRRLFSLLEAISRAGQNSDPRSGNLYQQSQLLVLRVIAMGMFYHWHQIYAAQGINKDRALVKNSPKNAGDDGDNTDGPQPIGSGYNVGEFDLYYPNPLEEPVAKRAFSIATQYFRNWASPHSVRLLADTVGSQSRYMFVLRGTHTSQSTALSASMMDIAIGSSMLNKFVRGCIAEPTADI